MTYRTLFALLFLGLRFMVTTPCSAQDKGDNERSKIVENFGGKPFYIHFVKDGQTLFAITKIYGVTSDALIANNPDLKTGLKADMILKIPFKDTIVIEEKQKPASFLKKKDTSTAALPEKKNSQIVYEIKRGETLYGIAKRYDVSLDEILKANPGITSMKKGDKIRIPVMQYEAVQATVPAKTIKPNITSPKANDVRATESKIPVNNTILNNFPGKNTTGQYKVALLVPFYLDEIDSIRVDQTEPKSFAFVQFYEASLLAVDSLRKQGLDVRLFVYDSDGDEGVEKTKAIFQKKELADMDLIIGPFYAKCFDIASRYAGIHKIPIVNPLSKRSEIITAKPWVFKVQPGGTGQMSELSAFINLHYANANVVLVRSDRSKMGEEALAFKDAMQLKSKKQNQPSVLKECFFVAEGIAGLSLKLSSDKPNILIVLSSEEVFVTGLLRKLDEISANYDLTVMGTAAWEQYKLDINSITHLKMHLFSNKYVDFSYRPVQQFSSEFLSTYNTLPQVKAYGFDGFDITYYFLSALMKYGRQFGRQIEEYSYQGLQDSFHFHKIEGGGYENGEVNFYKFENNNLKRVQ